jgi:ketosteroid isomerase-like protein
MRTRRDGFHRRLTRVRLRPEDRRANRGGIVMPQRVVRVALVAFALIAGAAPALAQSKAAIQKLEDQWGAAFNKGDAAAVAAMYTEDAYVLPAGAPMVKGQADIKCTAVDVMPIGRTGAREVGTCTFKTKGASPQDGALKYTVVWRKVGGQWLLNTDIWNMDK